MPPSSYAPAHSPASLDLPALDRVIATLLLGLDLVVVAVTGEQPGPTTSPAAGGPVADERARYYPAVQQQPNPAAEPTPPPRVLIADDVPAMRAALRGLLEDNGLPVIGEAADGLQAVTMAEQLQPDVVVMDVRMPGLDGLQAVSQSRLDSLVGMCRQWVVGFLRAASWKYVRVGLPPPGRSRDARSPTSLPPGGRGLRAGCGGGRGAGDRARWRGRGGNTERRRRRYGPRRRRGRGGRRWRPGCRRRRPFCSGDDHTHRGAPLLPRPAPKQAGKRLLGDRLHPGDRTDRDPEGNHRRDRDPLPADRLGMRLAGTFRAGIFLARACLFAHPADQGAPRHSVGGRQRVGVQGLGRRHQQTHQRRADEGPFDPEKGRNDGPADRGERASQQPGNAELFHTTPEGWGWDDGVAGWGPRARPDPGPAAAARPP
jgi:hypothetical protein